MFEFERSNAMFFNLLNCVGSLKVYDFIDNKSTMYKALTTNVKPKQIKINCRAVHKWSSLWLTSKLQFSKLVTTVYFHFRPAGRGDGRCLQKNVGFQ